MAPRFLPLSIFPECQWDLQVCGEHLSEIIVDCTADVLPYVIKFFDQQAFSPSEGDLLPWVNLH